MLRVLIPFGFLMFLLLAGCDSMYSAGDKDSMSPGPVDNTAVNRRDTQTDAKTPINQDENADDVARTAEIRKRVVKQEGLSLNARNVKIITSGGKVTLRGPVATDAERETIRQIAVDVAGDGNVDDQIDVPTPPQD